MSANPQDNSNTGARRRITRRRLLAMGLDLVTISSAGALLAYSSSKPGPRPPAHRPRRGGLDATFFVTADCHFGEYQNAWGNVPVNRRQVEAMNALPDARWPDELGGGAVEEPRGVIVCGDLTDNSRADGEAPQLQLFVEHYGHKGGDGLLDYPVFMVPGNHDIDPPFGYLGRRPVEEEIRRRHGEVYYSWDWDDLHLCALYEYPDATVCRWLTEDLRRNGVDRPVAMFMHFGLTGYGADDWSEREKAHFHRTIAPYNVVGIFHGHYHRPCFSQWRGIDCYDTGAPKYDIAPSFAVARITDTALDVGYWDYKANTWSWFRRLPVNGARVEAVTA